MQKAPKKDKAHVEKEIEILRERKATALQSLDCSSTQVSDLTELEGLIALAPAKLAQVPLDEQVRSEIDRARGIRSNVARKRQLQYVAKLLRRGDMAPVSEALDSFDGEAKQLNARHHRF